MSEALHCLFIRVAKQSKFSWEGRGKTGEKEGARWGGKGKKGPENGEKSREPQGPRYQVPSPSKVRSNFAPASDFEKFFFSQGHGGRERKKAEGRGGGISHR